MYTSEDFPKIVTRQSITVTHEGSPRVVTSDSPQYKMLLEAFKEDRWDDVPELLQPEKLVAKVSDGDFKVEEGEVFVKLANDSYWKCPLDLSDQILLYLDEELDWKPLVKFAQKLRENPSRSSVQQLFTWISAKNLTIKDNGNFVGYKGVRKNMMDVHSGRYDNTPGNTVSVERNEVDDNPDNTCSYGLHVGQFQYAKNFGPVVVLVEVNPKDVVAVPTDYNGEKMRVCEYTVLKEVLRAVDAHQYHDDDYDLPLDSDEGDYEDEDDDF
jgi:hypothetical protein